MGRFCLQPLLHLPEHKALAPFFFFFFHMMDLPALGKKVTETWLGMYDCAYFQLLI